MGKRARTPQPDSDLFDISDVTVEFRPTRNRRQVSLLLKSETDFNLMKYYLSLKTHLEQLETEIGIMNEHPREH